MWQQHIESSKEFGRNSIELPHSLEAEKAVLGAILLENTTLSTVVPILRSDDFYHEVHRRLYSNMLAMYESALPIDALTVSETTGRDDPHERGKYSSYLAALLDDVPDVSNVEHYAAIVKEKADLRSIMAIGRRAIAKAASGEEPAREVLSDISERLYEIAEHQAEQGFNSIKDITNDNLDVIDRLTETGTFGGLATGFVELDRMTAGLQKSDLVILAARPMVGKTALALNIAQNIALKGGTVGFFSLEMSKEQLGFRVLCSLADVDAATVRSGRASDVAIKRLVEAQSNIARARLYVDDSAVISVPTMRARAQKMRREHGLDLLVVDYLQLMEAHDGRESRVQEVTAITRGLKLLAKELHVPVLALSQLNRQSEFRAGYPRLSDLRDSGSIEQDADVVIFLYREEIHNPETTRRGIADCIVAKQRNGPIGDFPLIFMADRMTFQNTYSATKEAS
jgi:replicative DNA helicase